VTASYEHTVLPHAKSFFIVSEDLPWPIIDPPALRDSCVLWPRSYCWAFGHAQLELLILARTCNAFFFLPKCKNLLFRGRGGAALVPMWILDLVMQQYGFERLEGRANAEGPLVQVQPRSTLFYSNSSWVTL